MMQGSPAMSYIVLHMDKFKKEAVRGIQSHNLRERKSHSNPDIDAQRSCKNYELLEGASSDYARAVQNRIDDLLAQKNESQIQQAGNQLTGIMVNDVNELKMLASVTLQQESDKNLREQKQAEVNKELWKKALENQNTKMEDKQITPF